ncbi:synaptic vesicle glycoprotein 2B isoform X2 [Ceratitis capitata]|uniref:synaptic vesicle glycoprotein 2B isoform X2 n=1 Tax=Ceratitis capitata TaxID=7213 RepID=UPI000618919E|nr:synaptic vesicle glycoprotein 2B isoform X2 [Ceratitis capitata]
MCEFKEKQGNSAPESTKLTIATIEGGNVIASMPEPVKGAEYFESALEATTFGKFNYILILVSGLILANVLLETLGISFVLPVSQCDLNLTIQERGILSAIGFAGIISSSHLWGFLADTTGRRNVIRPTLLLGFVVTVVSSFATSFWLMVILRYINGFCISGGSATIYAFLGEFHTAKNRSRAIMGSAFIFGVGSMLMPCIAWLVINQEWRFVIPYLGITYKPWRFFMVVCGIPGFLCGLALFKIPESPKFLLSQGKDEKTLEILQMMFHVNTCRPHDQYPISHVVEDIDSAMSPKVKRERISNPAVALLRSMWDQTQPLFNREYMRTTILICSIQFWIFVTSNGMYMWFPHILNSVAEFMNENPGNRTYMCQIVYSKQQSIFDAENAHGAAVSDGVTETATQCIEKLEISTYQHSLVLEVLYAVGFALIGGIINKVGKQVILFVCLVACGACGIAATYADIPMVAIYLYVVLLLCGLGINVLSAATVDLYPTRLRAMAVCISLMMGRLGSVVGANVFGALLSHHCESAFIVSGVTLILSGFLGFFVTKKGKPSGKSGVWRRTSLISMTGN